MKIIEVDGKEYKVIKKYKHFTMCEDAYGLITCFDDFDLGLIPKNNVRGVMRWESDKMSQRNV